MTVFICFTCQYVCEFRRKSRIGGHQDHTWMTITDKLDVFYHDGTAVEKLW